MGGIDVLRCGIVNYQVMAESMKDLQKKRIAGEIGDTLMFVQHPEVVTICLLYTSPSPRDMRRSRMPSSA